MEHQVPTLKSERAGTEADSTEWNGGLSAYTKEHCEWAGTEAETSPQVTAEALLFCSSWF